MDIKLSEPISAAHLISAARMGNSKAEAVLNKGQSTKKAHTDTHKKKPFYLGDSN